jgi:GTP-binding protein Era
MSTSKVAVYAVVGRPNAGKSSLVNRIIGEHLSAVSPKPQTTWSNTRGILTEDRGQLVFIDTPGLHDAVTQMNAAMIRSACQGIGAADAAIFVACSGRLDEVDRRILDLAASRGPVVIVLSQIDRVDPEQMAADVTALQDWGAGQVLTVSAVTGEGLPELIDRLFELAEPGELLYPDEDLSDRSVREIVAEHVREAVFYELGDELPWKVLVEIEEFRESTRPIYIRAVMHVERDSQKRIVVGEGGRKIREIGTRARRASEILLDSPVYLDLWVKVLPKWTQREGALKRAGLAVGGRKDAAADALIERWRQRAETEES